MKIALAFPVLPPSIDGIGDYTAKMASHLSREADVAVITSRRASDPIEGVEVLQYLDMDSRKGVLGLVDAVGELSPDWLVLQFEQFSYGRWGLNPYLPTAIQRIRRVHPGTHVALMAHEDFVPPSSWKNIVMGMWQRRQFYKLGRASDLVLCSTEPWVERYQQWFPRAVVVHMPVSSNIPRTATEYREQREKLCIPTSTCVIGLFGAIASVRDLELVRSALSTFQVEDDVCILYVGTHGEYVEAALSDWRVINMGPLPADEVSRHFAAMDLYVAPFYEGVSTRRGSFLVGLQHGVPTVTTHGDETGGLLYSQIGAAFLSSSPKSPERFADAVRALWENPAYRTQVGAAGECFYESTLSWSALSNRTLQLLGGERPLLVQKGLEPVSTPVSRTGTC